jgi:hypothetical protein
MLPQPKVERQRARLHWRGIDDRLPLDWRWRSMSEPDPHADALLWEMDGMAGQHVECGIQLGARHLPLERRPLWRMR